jgi:hypothetical protein
MRCNRVHVCGTNQVNLLLKEVITPRDSSIHMALGSTLVMNAQNANATLLERLETPREPGSQLWIAWSEFASLCAGTRRHAIDRAKQTSRTSFGRTAIGVLTCSVRSKAWHCAYG